MKVKCAVCGKNMEITIDEFIDDNEYICNECSAAILEWCYELELRKN